MLFAVTPNRIRSYSRGRWLRLCLCWHACRVLSSCSRHGPAPETVNGSSVVFLKR